MPVLSLPSGATLAHADRGAGRPVVLLHGWSLASGFLEELTEALARTHRVIALDLRGHGGSAPGTPFGLTDLASDVAGLLAALDLRGAALVGWSLGGQVALEALGRADVRSRVDRLALLAATPCFTVRDGWPHGVPERAVEVIAHRVRREPARAFERFLRDALAPAERGTAEAAAAEARRAALPAPDPEAALAGLEVLATADLRSALAGLALPALVIHGTADPITPIGAGRALAAALPAAQLLEVAGAGHLPFLSAPGDVAGALAAFLGEAGAGRRAPASLGGGAPFDSAAQRAATLRANGPTQPDPAEQGCPSTPLALGARYAQGEREFGDAGGAGRHARSSLNPVDKRRVRAAFSRAAAAYDAGAAVQQAVQRRVLAAALEAAPAPASALDVGAGTGALVEALRAARPGCRVAAVDLATGMAAAARSRVPAAAVAAADAEALPFASGAFDLYLSTSTLQWLPRLEPALVEARRVLAPGGVLALALFGVDTLRELKDSWSAAAAAGADTRTHRFATCAEVAAALDAAGFAGSRVTEERIGERYPDARAVLRGLKRIGAVNAVPGARGLGGRTTTLALLREYQLRHAAPEGGVLATWHVVHALAVRP